MSFNKSVQKIFFMLAISISAVLLCLVGVWAATMNLNFQGKVSPDIHCKIVANGATIFNNYNDNTGSLGENEGSGNTLSVNVQLSAGITNQIEFNLTNHTPNKYIRLSVVSISSTDVISNKDSISAVCTNYTTTGDDKEGNPDAYATMTLSLTGNSTTDATIYLKVEEVYKVTVSGNGLATGGGAHYFAPSDACNITLEPMVGYQLPTTIIHGGIEGTTYTHTNTGAVVSAQSILKTDATIVANCNQIFGIKKSTAEPLGTPNANDDTKPFTIDNNKTYLPNNGHYVYNDGSTTTGTLKSTFVEYPYYVEMGMYPQSVVNGTPSVKNTPIYENLASTKTEEKTVITTIDNETNKAVIETTIETTITTNTTTTTLFTFTLTKDKTDEVAGKTTTNTTTETTYWEDATTTDKYAKIVVKDGVGVNATLKSTTYYKFEPIKWIILETTDKTPNDTTDDIALEDLYYKNGMFYTDGAYGKPYTGQFVLMSAYVIDGSIFNQQSNNNAVIYAGSTVDNYLNNHLNYNSTGNNGVNMGTITDQYADNKNLTSVNYTDDDSYNFNNALTTSFFLPGGTKTLNDADTGESYLVHKYFETTGINETSTQSTLNIGVASSTDFAIANGVETNIFAGKNGTESLSAKRGWMLENEDNTPISTSAYWTRSGGGNNGAIAVNMNGIPKNVQITNANIGIRPMMVLDLGFYENGTYTA